MERKVNLENKPYLLEFQSVEYKKPYYHNRILELLFVVEGKIEIEIEEEKFSLEEGDFISINAGYTHIIKSEKPALIGSLYFDLNHYEKLYPYIHGFYFHTRYREKDDGNDEIYKTIRNYFIRLMIINHLEIPQKDKIGSDICELIIKILINYVTDDIFTKDTVVNLKDLDRQRLFSITNYLSQHYKEKGLSLSDIANYENLSTTRLSHFWKNIVRISFMETINMYRYLECKRMLMSTDLPIVEVSEQSGFSDEKYLYKLFKSKTGMTPKEFRKFHKKIHESENRYTVYKLPEIYEILSEYCDSYYINVEDFDFLDYDHNRKEQEKKMNILYSIITSTNKRVDNNEKFEPTNANIQFGINSGLSITNGLMEINWEYVYGLAQLAIALFVNCGLSIDMEILDSDDWLLIFKKIKNEIERTKGKDFDKQAYLRINYSNYDNYERAMELAERIKQEKVFSKADAVFKI